MKLLLTFVISLMTVFSVSGQVLNSKDSLQITAMMDDWNKAWEIKDYKLASKWYSADARFTNAFGDKRKGQKEVETLLKEVFSLPFVMSGKSETTEHLFQTINNSVVVVHSAIVRKGQQMPDGRVMADRLTTHMRLFERVKGEWKIKAHLISDARDKAIPKH
jgi:uncharacterized protein (TIGR02246 family)